ncbi:hypothetical protein ACAG26_24155 [Mycobacterium sp. pUA109]|uniref:hypothetical protein n=1 Tax=Mycobacterium sp. pUA109 TaxID=3238982 RepID=UPI00351BBBCE
MNYTLPEVARIACEGAGIKDPERWLLTRVRAGKVSARRITRGKYVFTQEQLDELLASLDTSRQPEPAAEPDPEPAPTGRPTAASLRRRLRSAS